MMGNVPTVLGSCSANELGMTLMHEHVFLVQPEIALNYPERFDVEREDSETHERLKELKSSGIDTLVDLTVLGLGRDVARVRRVVEGTGLNVIVATGVYTFCDLPFIFKNWGPGTVNGGADLLEELLVRDIEVGIAGTGIRAGMLKCATDRRGVTPDVERVLRAVARIHRRTGTPITTHTDAATQRGLEQQLVFEQEGVDLSRVVIGHSGDSTDLGYLTRLMEAGSYIGMDRFGLETILGDEQRVRTVATLVEMGWAHKMVLSHDTSCFSQSYGPAAKSEALPHWTHDALLRVIVPRLREAGVGEGALREMLVDNPREIFRHAGAS